MFFLMFFVNVVRFCIKIGMLVFKDNLSLVSLFLFSFVF